MRTGDDLLGGGTNGFDHDKRGGALAALIPTLPYHCKILLRMTGNARLQSQPITDREVKQSETTFSSSDESLHMAYRLTGIFSHQNPASY